MINGLPDHCKKSTCCARELSLALLTLEWHQCTAEGTLHLEKVLQISR